MRMIVAVFALTALMIAGCNGPPPPSDQDKAGTPSKPIAEPPQPKADYAALRKAVEDSLAAYKKNPKDADATLGYSKALTDYGNAIQMDPAFSNKIKYRQAIQFFRKAVKLDPKNDEAQAYLNQIVAIYHSIPKPVPGEAEPNLELPKAESGGSPQG
jgi:tetratricopeptide (TPR) repeat protein